MFAGELAAAASLIDEVKIVTEATGSQLAPYGPLILAAWRGRESELSALTVAALTDVEARGEGIGVSTAPACQTSVGFVSAAHGEPDATSSSPDRWGSEDWDVCYRCEACGRTGAPPRRLRMT
jgi:hypothetical protein